MIFKKIWKKIADFFEEEVKEEYPEKLKKIEKEGYGEDKVDE